jgi:hypothetical protein
MDQFLADEKKLLQSGSWISYGNRKAIKANEGGERDELKYALGTRNEINDSGILIVPAWASPSSSQPNRDRSNVARAAMAMP